MSCCSLGGVERTSYEGTLFTMGRVQLWMRDGSNSFGGKVQERSEGVKTLNELKVIYRELLVHTFTQAHLT